MVCEVKLLLHYLEAQKMLIYRAVLCSPSLLPTYARFTFEYMRTTNELVAQALHVRLAAFHKDLKDALSLDDIMKLHINQYAHCSCLCAQAACAQYPVLSLHAMQNRCLLQPEVSHCVRKPVLYSCSTSL